MHWFERIILAIVIIVFAVTPAVYSLDIRVIWAVILDLEANSIAAIMSAVIAGLIFITTVWQIWQNHKRNKTLVRPHLIILRGNAVAANTRHYKVTLVNYGLGPAIIKNFELLYKGKVVSRNSSITYKRHLTKMMKKFKNKGATHRTRDSIIKTGEELILWEFKCGKDEDTKEIQKLKIRIEYQSIYEDDTFYYPLKKQK